MQLNYQLECLEPQEKFHTWNRIFPDFVPKCLMRVKGEPKGDAMEGSASAGAGREESGEITGNLPLIQMHLLILQHVWVQAFVLNCVYFIN